MEQSPSWEANSRATSQEIPAFYGILRFITEFTPARHWSLSWSRCTHSPPFHPISLRSILILYSHLRLCLPSGLFPLGFPTKMLYAFTISPCVLHDLVSSSFCEAYRLQKLFESHQSPKIHKMNILSEESVLDWYVLQPHDHNKYPHYLSLSYLTMPIELEGFTWRRVKWETDYVRYILHHRERERFRPYWAWHENSCQWFDREPEYEPQALSALRVNAARYELPK